MPDATPSLPVTSHRPIRLYRANIALLDSCERGGEGEGDLRLQSCLSSCLSTEEWQRKDSFSHVQNQRRYLLARSLLRLSLADCDFGPAEDLVFARDVHDKPFLQGEACAFNLSHSGDWVWLAVAEQAASAGGDGYGGGVSLGLDYADVQPRPRMAALAARYFHPEEQAHWQQRGESAEDFYSLWTLKEAWVKARGDGIAGGLKQFSVISALPVSTELEALAQGFATSHIDGRYLYCWRGALASLALCIDGAYQGSAGQEDTGQYSGDMLVRELQADGSFVELGPMQAGLL